MTEEQIKEYDLIFSLGGSCAAACQLDRRKLRFCSLPLDYTFYKNEPHILLNIVEAFDTNFEKFLLKENIRELQGSDRGADHNGKMQYIDSYTKIRWINHFPRPIEDVGAYEDIKEIIDGRIKRWVTLLSESKKVLGILTNATEIPVEEFKILTECFKRHFPNLEVDFRYIKFEAEKDEVYTVDNVTVQRLTKIQDFYDFTQTNYCWRFLDFCRISKTLERYRQVPQISQQVKQQILPPIISSPNSALNFEETLLKKLNQIMIDMVYYHKANKLKVFGYTLLLVLSQIPFLNLFVKNKKMILIKILKYWS